MAVTANQLITRSCEDKGWLPAAAVNLYQGTLAFLTAAGYATNVTATGVNGFAGIVIQQCDNSAGSAGDLKVELWREGVFYLTGSGFSQADVGSVVYAEDNYTIGLSISSASVPIGIVEEYVSATVIGVRIRVSGTGALPVAPLTTITYTAPGAADYAITVTNSSPYGFSNDNEAKTILSVIENLQLRVTDLEARRSC